MAGRSHRRKDPGVENRSDPRVVQKDGARSSNRQAINRAAQNEHSTLNRGIDLLFRCLDGPLHPPVAIAPRHLESPPRPTRELELLIGND